MKKKTAKPVNWEKLAKELQQALAKEIKENDELQEFIREVQIELIQASGIIKYLEIKRGNHPV